MILFYTIFRTITGLIYNALKLFMEENQKLFDTCTQNYNKQREQEKKLLADKQRKWEALEAKARNNGSYEEVQQEFKGTDTGGLFADYEYENGGEINIKPETIKEQSLPFVSFLR